MVFISCSYEILLADLDSALGSDTVLLLAWTSWIFILRLGVLSVSETRQLREAH